MCICTNKAGNLSCLDITKQRQNFLQLASQTANNFKKAEIAIKGSII